jgi:hypothetical protein
MKLLHHLAQFFPLMVLNLHDHAMMKAKNPVGYTCSCGFRNRKVPTALFNELIGDLYWLAMDHELFDYPSDVPKITSVMEGRVRPARTLKAQQPLKLQLPQAQLLDISLLDVSPELSSTISTLGSQLTHLATSTVEGMTIQRRFTALVFKLMVAWRSGWDIPTCGLLMADFVSEHFHHKTTEFLAVLSKMGNHMGQFMQGLLHPQAQAELDPTVTMSVAALIFILISAIVGYKAELPSIYTAVKI